MRWLLGILLCAAAQPAVAQIPPSQTEVVAYSDWHSAAHNGDLSILAELIGAGTDLEVRDASGRTAVHIAAHARQPEVLRLLGDAGADMNALEFMAYDAVTIAAVANDLPTLTAALAAGNRADLITSPYDGTALIAAAHLGHHQVAAMLIGAGAPLDHVNNLGWTAVMEAVVLGDGGPDHVETLRLLVNAGADIDISDRSGTTPLEHARARGIDQIADLLASAN